MILVFTMLMCDNGWSLLTESKVYAAESEDELDDGDDVVEEVQDSNSQETAVIVGEVVSERETYSKTYAMSDNSKMTVYYSAPVHYETDDGSLAEVDNSLVKSENGFKNAANSYTAEFKTGEDAGNVSFTEEDYEIGFTMLTENESSIQVDGDSLAELEREDAEEDQNTVSAQEIEDALFGHVIKESSIKYVGFDGGVDLEYTPTGSGLKENIILNEKGCKNEFGLSPNIVGNH